MHCGASTARLTFALWRPVTSPSPQSRQPRKCPGICQESAAGEGVGSKDPVENHLLLLCLRSLRSKGHNGIVTLLRKSHTQLHVTLLLDMKDGPSLPYGLGGGGWIIAHTVFPFQVFAVVSKSCLTACNFMDCSTPGFLALRYRPEFAQTRVH